MKTIKLTLILILTITIFGCNKKGDLLSGKWVRQDRALEGMVVSVVKVNNTTLYGKIENSNYANSFSNGETKWNNIKQLSETQFEIDDLIKGGNPQAQYRKSHLTIDVDTITIEWLYRNPGECVSCSKQKWVKLKEKK
jgi:hypothetical protein